MSNLSKISLLIASLIMTFYFTMQTMLVFNHISYSQTIGNLGYTCFLLFIPFFLIVVIDYVRKSKQTEKSNRYIKKLNSVLMAQTHNPLFYQGDVVGSSKILTKEVIDSIETDRCSIWLYNSDKTSINCQQLYIKSEEKWYKDIELFKKDFQQYFDHLATEPFIIANDAETHPGTSCFTETYLKPLGIKSMMDVPIIFKGDVIGVICIESLSKRNWLKCEIDFAQMISSLYSFSLSVREGNSQKVKIEEIEKFIDESALISKADERGKITYVNKKFTEVSGYTLDDVIGKDHSIVNSGYHPSEMWSEMYNVVIKERGIWNKIVTNKAKNGHLYYVDTYIRAQFDPETNKLKGFTSIRQDVTELKIKEVEIRNRMNAINKSNAVIEFDLSGKIMFANDLFCNTMGYVESEIVGRYHKMFVGEEYLFSNSRSKEYKEFWKKLKNGEFVSGEFERVTKSGRKVWLQASYNPIVDNSGNVYKIMKIATDITERIEQSGEIEKKNVYLEHAAKILRHDMHSGINTYIPRGVSSLERRLTEDDIKNLKIEAPLKMIKEGLKHTQKVYKGVYEFTNLVKKDVVLTKAECNIKSIMDDYLSSTSYKSQVILDSNLPTIDVNESLFCTSIDNLIRNGLKYNDNDTKFVKIYSEDEHICIVDNGRGMTQEDFIHLSKPYVRKEGQKESGTGLGLNICIAILKEHGFSIVSEKLPEGGTKIKIKIK